MPDRQTLLESLAGGDAGACHGLLDGCQQRAAVLVHAIVPGLTASEHQTVLKSFRSRLDQLLHESVGQDLSDSFDRTVITLIRDATFDLVWEKACHQIERRVLKVLQELPYAQRDADELLQEAWIRGRRSFSDFVWRSEGLFVSWIAAIMRHRAQELRRHRNPAAGPTDADSSTLRSPEPQASGPSPSQRLRAVERFQRFQAALAQLSADDRKLIHLRYFEKRSVADTAAQLGLTEDVVKTRALRARERLRRALGDSFTPSLPFDSHAGPSDPTESRDALP